MATADSILYACVVQIKDKAVLADCTYRHSSSQLTQTVQKKIIPLTTSPNYTHVRSSFTADDMLFQISRKNNEIVFLCVTTPGYTAYMAFNFLDKIANTFFSFYKDATQRSVSICQPFIRILRQEGEFFNSPDANKLKKVQSQIDEVKNVMMENLDAVIQRGDKIENLVDKSSTLLDESQSFVTNSTSLKRKMRWRQIKIVLAIILLIAVIITVIVLIACQGFKSGNRCQN